LRGRRRIGRRAMCCLYILRCGESFATKCCSARRRWLYAREHEGRSEKRNGFGGFVYCGHNCSVNGVAREVCKEHEMRRWSVVHAMMRAKAEAAAGRQSINVAAPTVLSFGTDNALQIHTPTRPTPSLALDVPLFSLIRKTSWGGSMASNKKSGLTGYLPDILMAAAAVRSRSFTRHLTCPLETIPNTYTAVNSVLRYP
jgi:hypothetical protein